MTRRRLEHAQAARIIRHWKPDTTQLQAVWDGARISPAVTREIEQIRTRAWLLPASDRDDLIWLRNWTRRHHHRRLRRPPEPRFEPFPDE